LHLYSNPIYIQSFKKEHKKKKKKKKKGERAESTGHRAEGTGQGIKKRERHPHTQNVIDWRCIPKNTYDESAMNYRIRT